MRLSLNHMRDAIVESILVISTPFLRPASASVGSKQCMYGSRTTIETIDTNQDRATEFPRQLWSSFSNMRDANVHGILVISTPFLRPASASVVSKQCMYGSRTTIKTIDTNRDRATESRTSRLQNHCRVVSNPSIGTWLEWIVPVS